MTEAARAPGNQGPRAAFLLMRWRMFWGAPVTVFLGNVVMYFAFLFLFTYVLLVDFRPPPQGPSGPEVTLYFWVFTLVLEEIRQVSGGPCSPPPAPSPGPPAVRGPSTPLPLCQGFFTDEDTRLVKKFTVYVEDHWNKCDMVAIFLFIVGVACRSVGPRALGMQRPQKSSLSLARMPRVLEEAPAPPWGLAAPPICPLPTRMLPSVFEAGRTVLAVDFMVFTLRLIHIFAVHKQLGPKIIIVERMVSPGPGRPPPQPGPGGRSR